MTLAKKGLRRLVLAGTAYRFKVSRWRRVSEWSPASAGLVDERWVAEARKLGLGDTANVEFTIAVQAEAAPASKLIATYHAKVVDGFLGIEQWTRIGPSLVVALIEHSVAAGWDPLLRGDYRVHVVENRDGPVRPLLLVLPGLTRDDPSYPNRVVPIRITP